MYAQVCEAKSDMYCVDETVPSPRKEKQGERNCIARTS